MHYEYTSLITASVLALAAASASGQIQPDSPRQGLQIAERLMQERSGLYSAIAIAETHTKGVAIGVRLSTNQDLLAGQDRAGVSTRTIGHTSDPNAASRQDTDRSRPTGQPQTQHTGQRSAQSDRLFAIVTCVVDRTKVRDVVIDMGTNTVIDVQSAAYHGSEQSDLDRYSEDDRDYSRDYDASLAAAGGFSRASDLMNATVRNTAGERLGDIDELAIDPDSNRVVYGVLRRGGFLGMGESRYAIPVGDLTPPQNGRMMLGLDESHFENIAGFDNNNWPTQAEPKLRIGQTTTQAANVPAAKRVVKASNIIGSEVQCRDKRTLGVISDLVVEPRTGRVLYAVVKTDRGHMPVPMSTLTKTDKTYSLPMPMDQLRSMPMLDTNRDPNWADESWNRRIHESYGTKYETASVRDGR